MSKYLGRISTRELVGVKPTLNSRELNPMSTSIQNGLLDQNISNSLETRDHPQAKWILERTNELSAFQKLLPNFDEHPNYMHFYLDHDEIQGHEMILNSFGFIWNFFGPVEDFRSVRFYLGLVWVDEYRDCFRRGMFRPVSVWYQCGNLPSVVRLVSVR